MKCLPLISVIIPMYNAERYIERCLKSVLNQTYSNIEIIVIDDGSQDNCGKIVQSLIEANASNKRIQYYWKRNGGVSAARNYGLEKATGEFFAFVDADDTIAPNMYESLFNLLQQYNADLVICGRTRIIDSKEIHYRDTGILHFFDGKVDMKKLSNQFDLNILVNKLYSRSLWGNLQLPEKMSYAEDLFLVPDILGRSKHIVYTSVGFYNYYENLSSASFHLNKEKLYSDLMAKSKLYQYLLSKSVDISIAFDWLFGAYVRGWSLTKGQERFCFWKKYILFYLRNWTHCIAKIKCSLFLFFPSLYVFIKKYESSHQLR